MTGGSRGAAGDRAEGDAAEVDAAQGDRPRTRRRRFGVLGKQHASEPTGYAKSPRTEGGGFDAEFWEEQRPPHWGGSTRS
ncbi:hypothetical protein F7232_03125 [Corynebacterium sp. 319]|uniref:hypothetical protein n=1 Tax=unclassified Corynebacterium TaxID=2624378 RepID=UPI00125CC5EA|nr:MULTISPECIES: hypothetical protein [unclassified Corynebacterium]KAB1552799.1 hypothetical protein F7233_03460 [Corynebacterium sp. 321]KAB1553983.1 hypothetical protein F7232_03125 [Corynebacterium sp. 319]KAB3540274.1 hypothetical protein F8390_03205 [Corynebacterium sp. 366]